MDDTKVTTEEAISWLEKRLEQRPTPGERVVFSMALSSLRAQQEKKPDGWISVNDRLPYHLQTVIALHKNGSIHVEEYRALAILKSFSRENFYGPVTHWQDFPELPEVF